MREMIERAAEAFREAFKRPFGEYPPEELHQPWEHAMVRAALLAALDPSDEALVNMIAQRLADQATKDRNELRMIRQGIDLSNAQPVSPVIFKKDARLMLEALHQSISPQTGHTE